MELVYKKLGQGDPLVILHGLYGMSDNWLTIAKALENEFEIYLIDQRNHGNSPHDDEHTYQAMARDLFVFANHHSLNSFHLLGHSMGGKTAMTFALKYANYVNKLVIVDISPHSYENNISSNSSEHKNIMEAMLNADFSKLNSRREIASYLSEKIGSDKIAQFLLKNIERVDEKYKWKLNIEALYKNLTQIMQGIIPENESESSFNNPTLFIKGEKSQYLKHSDYSLINSLFPNSNISTIKNAGHWVHAEQPELFVKQLLYFLEK